MLWAFRREEQWCRFGKKKWGRFGKNNFYFEQNGDVLVKRGGVLVVGAI